ncbi:hypothetical protein PSPO01_10117 [Paraphaeosphaeria sporulosa]
MVDAPVIVVLRSATQIGPSAIDEMEIGRSSAGASLVLPRCVPEASRHSRTSLLGKQASAAGTLWPARCIARSPGRLDKPHAEMTNAGQERPKPLPPIPAAAAHRKPPPPLIAFTYKQPFHCITRITTQVL